MSDEYSPKVAASAVAVVSVVLNYPILGLADAILLAVSFVVVAAICQGDKQ